MIKGYSVPRAFSWTENYKLGPHGIIIADLLKTLNIYWQCRCEVVELAIHLTSKFLLKVVGVGVPNSS